MVIVPVVTKVPVPLPVLLAFIFVMFFLEIFTTFTAGIVPTLRKAVIEGVIIRFVIGFPAVRALIGTFAGGHEKNQNHGKDDAEKVHGFFSGKLWPFFSIFYNF
jgi:hypothetical protein